MSSDVSHSLQNWVSVIQSVVLTADVFQFFIKYQVGCYRIENMSILNSLMGLFAVAALQKHTAQTGSERLSGIIIMWWHPSRYPCRMNANIWLNGNPLGCSAWPRRHRQGLRRLHEGACAVAIVVRALYCVTNFHVKQEEVFFDVWGLIFFGPKNKCISKRCLSCFGHHVKYIRYKMRSRWIPGISILAAVWGSIVRDRLTQQNRDLGRGMLEVTSWDREKRIHAQTKHIFRYQDRR